MAAASAFPWRFPRYPRRAFGPLQILDAKGIRVASVYATEDSPGNREANAALVLAAPEMFAVLARIAEWDGDPAYVRDWARDILAAVHT